MKTDNFFPTEQKFSNELDQLELISVNGGEDPGLAYIAGFTHVFVLAHFLTGGLLTSYYLIKKAT